MSTKSLIIQNTTEKEGTGHCLQKRKGKLKTNASPSLPECRHVHLTMATARSDGKEKQESATEKYEKRNKKKKQYLEQSRAETRQ